MFNVQVASAAFVFGVALGYLIAYYIHRPKRDRLGRFIKQ